MNIIVCNKCGKPLIRKKDICATLIVDGVTRIDFCKECNDAFWNWLKDGDKKNFNIKEWDA